MTRRNGQSSHGAASPPVWSLVTIVIVGVALLAVTLCPNVHRMGRTMCGFIGAVLVLAFAASIVGARVIRAIIEQLRRSRFGR